MLRELTDKNLTYLHMWGENLQNTASEEEIRDCIKKTQEDAGFLEFYFLSADGNYKMITGETGYLGLQENLEDKITLGEDIITNAVVPGKQQMLVFASPQSHGSYQGFEYDAIAIAYENADIVDVLDISAFNGNAQSFIVHPDGRSYYLVYEKSDIQDWMFLGLVQADIVNASMNSLQRSTMLLVGMVVLCIAVFL